MWHANFFNKYDADASATVDTLDPLGRRTRGTDEASLSTDFSYDELGRLITVTDAAGNATTYSYDEVGNKLTQTDAQGRTTIWAYDALGRITSRTLPMGQVETFGHDGNGNNISHTDFNGNTHSYVYDTMNQMVEENTADGRSTTYGYNAIGNRTQRTISDSDGTRVWAYDYDTLHRLTLETKPDGSTLAYQYDAAGNKSQLITTDVAGFSQTINYSYDALNRLESVTNTDGITSYGYDEVGNRSSISYPNGTSQTWAYDSRNRLTSTSIYRANGARIQSFDYTLHPTGRRTQITELNGRTSSYTYHDRYWLTSEAITDAINGNYSASYQYDSVGNRTQSIEDGVTTAYSYDQNDRITQQGGVVYSYDGNGNTVTEDDQGVLTNYAYNDQNQLISHTASGLTTRYQYNADGTRHSKSDSLATTQFLVDANRDYAQVLAESVDGVTDVTYHFGDDLISQRRDAGSRYFHTDGLGSTRVLTDAKGATTDTYAYSAFGDVLNQTGISNNSYLYTGEQYDAGLDQYYLRARYYDQGVGRFTQMDSWMGHNSDPVTLQKYLYANVDPAYFTDPTGNFGLAEINVGLSVTGAFFSGYSIGTGATKLSEGEYSSGFVDIGLGFMGTGVLAKAPFAINGASKLLTRHRTKYISMVEDLSRHVVLLRGTGKTSMQIAEWAVQRRNEIKILIRKEMVDGAGSKTEKALALAANLWAEGRNYFRYGDKVGPTVKWYLSNTSKGYIEIVEGAARASDDVTRFFSTTGWGLLP